MAINKASLIIAEGNQLLDATIVASQAISLSNARVTQILKMLGPKVSVMATKATAIKAIVVAMAGVMGRSIVRLMLWMPMSSRGIWFISLKGINQGYQVIISIGLTRLSQKTEFRNCSL